MVNYYKDMWKRCAKLLAPRMELREKEAKFQWTKGQQDALEQIKRMLVEEMIQAYPDFSCPFVVCTGTSDYQMGGVITQEGKPLAFFLAGS